MKTARLAAIAFTALPSTAAVQPTLQEAWNQELVPEAFAAFVRADAAQWSKLARERGIKSE